VLFVVGNKLDLQEKREVPKEKGEEYAKSLNAPFSETSAATDIGEDAHNIYTFVCTVSCTLIINMFLIITQLDQCNQTINFHS